MLDTLQDAITAARRAIEVLEAQLADLTAAADALRRGHDTIGPDDLQDTMTPVQLHELLRSAAAERLAEWETQGYSSDDPSVVDGILDPFDQLPPPAQKASAA